MARSRAHNAVEAVLLEFLGERGLAPEDGIAVALSGGPDSTALLLALAGLDGWRPVAVHVDHGIRPRDEINAELSLVKSLCADLRIRLIVAHVRPGAIAERAKASGEGIEAEARRFRYAALRRSALKTGVASVLIAHTRDDQIETILMRLLSGSGAAGLRGIRPISGIFMRPFLRLGKNDLIAYLESRGRGYSTDSTNESDEYRRNRIRQKIVPVLDSTFSGWRSGLARAAFKAERDEKALEAAAGRLAFSSCPDGSLSAPARPLLEASDAIAIRAIVDAAGKLLGRVRVSSDMASSALEALRRGGRSAYRGSGLELRLSEDQVILRRITVCTERGGLDFPRRDGYFVVIDGPCRIRVGKLRLRASWSSEGERGIWAESFRFPLVVRSRRPGDAIALKAGTKRLDALFSEWSLPDAMRGVAPVVEDRDGIVAVLGAGIGGKDRYRAIRAGGEPSGELGRRFTVIVKGA